MRKFAFVILILLYLHALFTEEGAISNILYLKLPRNHVQNGYGACQFLDIYMYTCTHGLAPSTLSTDHISYIPYPISKQFLLPQFYVFNVDIGNSSLRCELSLVSYCPQPWHLSRAEIERHSRYSVTLTAYSPVCSSPSTWRKCTTTSEIYPKSWGSILCRNFNFIANIKIFKEMNA